MFNNLYFLLPFGETEKRQTLLQSMHMQDLPGMDMERIGQKAVISYL